MLIEKHNPTSKCVLITGATYGIGFEMAKRLHDLNYEVIGIARSKPDYAFPGHLFLTDLLSAEKTATILTEIKSKFNIDIVINNVGGSSNETVGEITLETFNHIINLNVRTTLQVTQACLENMKKNQWGRIINMASVAIYGVKNRSMYAAAKSAVVGFTKTWALELAPYNITVNAIAPGPTKTPLLEKMRPPGSSAEKEMLERIPLKRLGNPSEIAALVALLASEEGGFITGQTLSIDGGASI